MSSAEIRQADAADSLPRRAAGEPIAVTRAVVATGAFPDAPLDGLDVRDVAHIEPPPGWVRVEVRAAGLNYHDVFTLRGLTGAQYPCVLGTDAAGVTDDGHEVVVHAVLRPGDLLSESVPGTLAEYVYVPAENCVAKPSELSFEHAACLPTAWLTAYNMLFGKAHAQPGEHVLIQGAGGGVATAAITLAHSAGIEITATSRSAEKLDRAVELGAHHVLASGERLPTPVDVVIDTVGEATWRHSLRSVRRGGRIVTAGGTSGFDPPAALSSLFMNDVTVYGTYMGSRQQLEQLVNFLRVTGCRPTIDSIWELAATADAVERMLSGEAFGKILIRPS